MLSREAILSALSQVEDPDLKKDLVTLGMIEKLEITDKVVSFDLILTTPACPMKDMLVNACKTAIKYMLIKRQSLTFVSIAGFLKMLDPIMFFPM